MNRITINITPCSTAPSNGYDVYFRQKNSSEPYTLAGNFTASPIVFNNNTFPDGTDYEGYIVARIGTDLECPHIVWNTSTIVTPPPANCTEYVVSGNDENSYVDYVDCVTGENRELNIGNTVVNVCSRTTPNGGGISIVGNNGACTGIVCKSYQINGLQDGANFEYEDCNGQYQQTTINTNSTSVCARNAPTGTGVNITLIGDCN